MTKLRLANYMLMVEQGRRSDTEVAKRVCPLCSITGCYVLEDEYHFVMCCPSFNALREMYLSLFIVDSNYANFVTLFSSEQIDVQRSTAAYVYHAFQMRKYLLS